MKARIRLLKDAINRERSNNIFWGCKTQAPLTETCDNCPLRIDTKDRSNCYGDFISGDILE